jgi:hypothetical protein
VGFGDPYTTTQFASQNGWSDTSNYSSIRTPDLDGDGRSDVCGRGDARLYCALSTGTGWGDTISGPEISDAAGYEDLAATTTVRFGDVDADGDADVCARNTEGIRCWPWTGAGFGDAIDGPTLSDSSGWGAAQYHGTIRMGDVNGDDRMDICARAASGMLCWIADGTGFPSQVAGPAWSDDAGWNTVDKWSTIRLEDIDADGMADLCGRGPAGVECARSQGTSFAAVFAGPTLSDDSGWADHDNYSTIRLGDVDADADLDLCARANARVYCWLQDGDDFSVRVDGPELSDDAGWDDPRYYTTLRLADLDGDHDADLCARSSAGISCWLSDGAAFGEAIAGPTLSDASGWDARQYVSSIRFGGVVPIEALVNSGDSATEAEPTSPSATVKLGDVGCGCRVTNPATGLLAGVVGGVWMLFMRRGWSRRRESGAR